MAGQYVSIVVPGYNSLFVRDLSYVAGTGDASDVNPFSPTDMRPLIEGEWLERTGADKVTRGGNNAVASSGTKDGAGTKPAFLFFSEKGRYDVQMTKRAHIITGPSGFEFRTKLCTDEGFDVGDPVAVFDWDGVAGAYGIVRRVLGVATSGSFVVGRVTRVYGTSDIGVLYNPEGLLA
jgi:hypothetical protein